MSLLRVNNLCVSFFTDAGEVRAVRGLSFALEEGKTLGLVGESGCGKSVTALSIMRLIPFPGKITAGEIFYRGNNLLSLEDKAMQDIRGNEIAFVFQEPLTALNPVFSIGNQLQEPIRIHQKVAKKEALRKTVESLGDVGIPEPQRIVKNYPHQLSGGMLQRVMIAMALSCNPSLLIADEPTTALDVTIQAEILELIAGIQKERNMAMILITHDLGIVADRVDYTAIMYCGKIIEYAATSVIIKEPLHPYTQGLLESIPALNQDKGTPLRTIRGTVPSLLALPKGCSFCDRCFKVSPVCHDREPELLQVGENRWVACHRVESKI